MNRLAKILVSGGLQRPEAESSDSLAGNHYYRARLALVDMARGAETTLMDYESPPEARPDEWPGIRFTAMTLVEDRLYLCTGTEIFLYEYPSLRLLRSATHPHFNDIHHVAPVGGEIAVADTGLDMVLFLDPESLAPRRYCNVVRPDDPWFRHDPSRDYRKVHSTQPHDAHPNFVFTVNGEPWVTRGRMKDALCLADPGRTVRLGRNMVHDGVVRDGRIYFTEVTGRIIVVDAGRMEVAETIDLAGLEGSDLPPGWCRGFCLDGDVAYVAFTTLRTTRWKENVERFLNSRTGEYVAVLPTRICAYDLKRRVKLGEYVVPRESLGAIFSLAVCREAPLSLSDREPVRKSCPPDGGREERR